MKLVCCYCGHEVERSQALVHLAERGCKEIGWVYILPNRQSVRIENVTGLQSLELDADDLAMDEFDPFDGDEE